ncbi:MAG: hypothetical protein MJE63_00635 [Proteobacteria bacterium]|nr:hypothetical protein [Pseudomonadota bacterium]
MAEKKAGKKKKSGKKSGKLKWIFLILIVLIAAIFGVYYFGLDQKVAGYLPNPEIVSKPKEYFSKSVDYVSELKTSFLSDEEGDTKSGELSPSIIELEGENTGTGGLDVELDYSSRGGYYVKVEDCINITCQQEVSKFLKRERLPFTKKESKRKTRYYELISSTVFTRVAAKAKIEALKQEPVVKGDPFMVKVKNRYKISLGQFPKEDTGLRVKADLMDLYPKLKIEFEIKPKTTYYRVNSFYTGPFNKSKANSIHKRLKENPEYESSVITRKI